MLNAFLLMAPLPRIANLRGRLTEHLEVVGAADGGGTVAQVLTGDVVVACL